MNDRSIKSVAIVGGDVAGWLSAAVLATMLGPHIEVTLIDCHLSQVAPSTQATLPPIKALHAMLGIDEAELLGETQGTMKLGSQYVNWGSLGNRYFQPHGAYGAEFDVVGLHHWWLKARASDPQVAALSQLSFAAQLAQEGRFTHPVADRRLIQATHDYAYHLDMSRYCDFLRKIAQSRGVITRTADIVSVTRAENGNVDGLRLSDGQTCQADLYIDCSGLDRIVIGKALETPFQSWAAYLPCTKAISLSCQSGGDFSPATRITAREAGWQWRTPLQSGTSMGYVYSDAHLGADDALANLMENLDGPLRHDSEVHEFTQGVIATPFSHNVVAIGDAAGFLDPLEATGLHMVQSALTRLLALWPDLNFDSRLAREYNEVTATEWARARDFLVLHYHATKRADTSFWRDCANLTIPDSLSNRLEHWRSSGRLISPGPEVFQSSSWLSLYVGQDIAAGGWDPLADARADQVDYTAKLSGLASLIAQTAQAAPEHRAFIQSYCRAKRG
jgi:tryptophan 7-halogenase